MGDLEKTDDFKKHEKITETFVSNLEKGETKGAPPEKGKESSSELNSEIKKTEGEENDVVEKAEEKAAADEKILNTPDEELDEEKKSRKAELLEKKEKKIKLEPEEAKQAKLDKRFGELTGEIKDLKKDKTSSKERISELEQELAGIKKTLSPSAADVAATARKAEKEKYQRYVDEDKDKPREERREISKDDLEEWLMENNLAAEEWLAERSLRRSEERREEKVKQKKDEYVQDLTDKMDKSAKRVEAKHPELATKSREEELKRAGKTDKEIHDTLCGENEKYRLMHTIIKEDFEKYLVGDGPELAAKEMEKRLKHKPNTAKKEYTDEEMDQIKKDAKAEAIAEEKARLAGVDEGITSSQPRQTTKTKLSAEMEGKLAGILKKAGMSRKDYDESVSRREKMGV